MPPLVGIASANESESLTALSPTTRREDGSGGPSVSFPSLEPRFELKATTTALRPRFELQVFRPRRSRVDSGTLRRTRSQFLHKINKT